eukprot:148370-Alexandrium_andersonii.AAC.1
MGKPCSVTGAWERLDVEGEHPMGGPEQGQQDGQAAHYWEAFNEHQRGQAAVFAKNPNTPAGLLLWHVCGQPSIHLTQRLLHLASPAWEERQAAEAASVGSRLFRVTVASKGLLAAGFFEEVTSLATDQKPWAVVPADLRTMRMQSMAFSFLARQVRHR